MEKITYREIKDNQTKDLRSQTSRYMIYRNFSTPFTYIFVKIGVSPSAISILNFFPTILGYFLLSTGNYFLMVLGLMLFIIFKILDCCDGEVARILNPKAMVGAHKNIEGVYFDAIGHFIYPICLGMGLGIGLYRLHDKNLYITVGFLLALLFTLEVAVINELVRSYLRKGIIERGIRNYTSDKEVHGRLMEKINEGHSWSKLGLLSRLFGVYPFQGLFYSGEFIVPILIFLFLIEYLSHTAVNIISLYIFLIIIVKSVHILLFIYKMKKKAYITNLLKEIEDTK